MHWTQFLMSHKVGTPQRRGGFRWQFTGHCSTKQSNGYYVLEVFAHYVRNETKKCASKLVAARR